MLQRTGPRRHARQAVYEASWWRKFEELKTIATKNGGDPNLPQSHSTHGAWLNTQRMAYKAKRLAPDQVQALEALGILWEPQEDRWDEMFERLKALAKDNGGDPNVPRTHSTHGTWLHTQRMAYKADKLAADRVQALEAVGVKWRRRAPRKTRD